MDSILISAGPILDVYKVDSLPSALPQTPVEQQHLSRAAKTQNKCKIIKRHTHTHQSRHANSFFIGTAVINTHTHTNGRLQRHLWSAHMQLMQLHKLRVPSGSPPSRPPSQDSFGQLKCPPKSADWQQQTTPPPNSCVIGTAVINTHTNGRLQHRHLWHGKARTNFGPAGPTV